MDLSCSMPHHHENIILLASIAMGGLGCLIFAVCKLLVWWSKSETSGRLRLPPGSFGLPWIGESLQFLSAVRAGELERFLEWRVAKFGSETFKSSLLGHRTVVVRGGLANRFLAKNENCQRLLGYWPASTLSILGDHAPIVKHGAEHRRLRHLMASCLSPLVLQKLVAGVEHMTQCHFDKHWHGQQRLTLCPLLKLHTFGVACSFLAGVEDDALLAHLHPHFNAWLAGFINLPIDLPGTKYRKAKNARRVLVQEMGKVIERKRKELEKPTNGHSKPEDLLSILLMARDEDGSFLRHEEIQDVLLFLLLAAHDTSACALTFSIKFLAENPACYERVVQEQEEIASQKKPGEKLNWADVQNMKYTWKVIQETLRLRSPSPGGLKKATQDLDFNGYLIPKGWTVFYSISSTHHDGQYFPDPKQFDPSRFDEERERLPPYLYVPFGLGPHSCPGGEFAKMALCVFLHQLVRRFTWTFMDPKEAVRVDPTPFPVKGYPITIFEKM